MTTDDWTLKTIGHASAEDHALFEKWCGPTIKEFGPRGGLGRNGKPMPQGAGAHCVQWWRDIQRMLNIGVGPDYNDCHVFEIGFCIGLSARILLELKFNAVTSVDPSDHQECRQSAKDLGEGLFHNYFLFQNKRSDQVDGPKDYYGLAFIDGDHEYDSIITDIGVCRRLGIKTMVFDDWHPHFGPHTQRAVIDAKLRVRAIIGNYALCEDDL